MIIINTTKGRNRLCMCMSKVHNESSRRRKRNKYQGTSRKKYFKTRYDVGLVENDPIAQFPVSN